MDSDYILSSIRKIVRALNLESKRIQKEFGISIPQLLCLTHLNQVPGFKASTKELSEALNLNPSTITGITRRLEQKRLIARLPKGADKRVTHLTLTADGANLLASTPKLFHQKLDERIATLSPEEISQIDGGLSTIIRLLGVNELDAAPILTVPEPLDATQEEGNSLPGDE